MLVLDIDIGNTRIKCRLYQHKNIILDYVQPSHALGVDLLLQEIQSILPNKLDRCRLSCVKSDECLNKVNKKIESQLCVQVELPEVTSHTKLLTVNGVNPKRLGVDRWLAMLAARDKYPGRDLLVADCGTALTIEKVHKNGEFAGGFIVPGIEVMLKSLTDSADLLTLPKCMSFSREPAKRTIDCLQNGVATMMVSFLEKQYQEQEADICLVVTGGDAPVVESLIRVPVQHEANLVLDGLAIALP